MTPSWEPVTAGIPRSRSTAAATTASATAGVRSSASTRASASAMDAVVAPSAYKLGARATYPAAASRSHASVKTDVSPHQACSTSTPGPTPPSGTARYT
jgi:hypothetical protein